MPPLGLVGAWLLLALMLAANPLAAQSDSSGVNATVASQIDSLSFRSEVEKRRFLGLVGNMRCLQNPGQSLLESTAPEAHEKRMIVFNMLQDTTRNRADFEIRLAMVDMFGDDVLYQSAFAGHRLLIWAGPVLLLVVGLIAAFIVSMRKRRSVAHAAKQAR
ncbi:MAG: cytochrome c-type biogenesis protein [Wenzhouxiangella sp.]